jgi:hypothetical protein
LRDRRLKRRKKLFARNDCKLVMRRGGLQASCGTARNFPTICRKIQVCQKLLHLVYKYEAGIKHDGRDAIPQQVRIDAFLYTRGTGTIGGVGCSATSHNRGQLRGSLPLRGFRRDRRGAPPERVENFEDGSGCQETADERVGLKCGDNPFDG